jgi:glycosyltransferase involved in cell wall biosynthesis
MIELNIPRVSIGLPVFNGEQFLIRALDSLLAQNYSDFELIISDNGSTDGTEKICKDYASRDHRIRYIRQSQNLGSHENFNFVLRESRGEYFMWAAADDLWDRNFIDSLLKSLESNSDVVGAFCPYQLVEAETGTVMEGIWKLNYESQYAFIRLLKFSWYYRDTCIYGLLRKQHLKDLRFRPWAWINSKTPYNVAYPMVYYLLSKGNLLFVGERPLWFKSVTIRPAHYAPFMSNPLLAYLAHIIRKINLFLRNVRYIYRGSGSVPLAVLMIPFLVLRFLIDCIAPAYAAIRIWLSGKKISQLSPHEIWRLGVR